MCYGDDPRGSVVFHLGKNATTIETEFVPVTSLWHAVVIASAVGVDTGVGMETVGCRTCKTVCSRVRECRLDTTIY